jgi:hypothetical protein
MKTQIETHCIYTGYRTYAENDKTYNFICTDFVRYFLGKQPPKIKVTLSTVELPNSQKIKLTKMNDVYNYHRYDPNTERISPMFITLENCLMELETNNEPLDHVYILIEEQ